MRMAASLRYWLFVQNVLGAGSVKLLPILERFGTARRFHDADIDDIVASRLLNKSELERFKHCTLDECDALIDYCIKHNYDIITPNDERYPKRLTHLIDPPAALFVRGEFPDFDDEVALAMVGTRKCSDHGKIIAEELSAQLSSAGALIVSGGALGIDAASHRGALKVGARTVAVLGCGFDCNYLAENRELREEIAAHGALISEYPPKTGVSKFNFPVRNRLISGLCLGTIVVEAKAGSGSLITVDHALEQGRDIFVVPGEVADPLYAGSNKLIRDGARAIVSAADVLYEYNDYYPHRINFNKYEEYISSDEDKSVERMSKKRAELIEDFEDKMSAACAQLGQSDASALSPNAKMLYNAFKAARTDSFDVAASHCSLSPDDAIAALTELEIFGLVSAIPGGRYSVQ